jgi:hypothetical protein
MKSPIKQKSALEVLKKTPNAPAQLVLFSAGASIQHVALPAVHTARANFLMSRNTQETPPKPLYFGVVPYIAAMRALMSPADRFGFDEGQDVCIRFLSNFSRERGDAARVFRDTVKAHLALIGAGFTPFTPHDYLERFAGERMNDYEVRASFEAQYRGLVIYA